MGILDRFTSIVKANINELLDKAEDPEKMVDQYLREMTESLAEVREATAGVMAEEKRCKKLLDENREETEKYEELARKALAAGNEADARVFLAKKQELAGRAEGLTVAYEGQRRQNAPDARQAGGRHRGVERTEGDHQGEGRRGENAVQGERDDLSRRSCRGCSQRFRPHGGQG